MTDMVKVKISGSARVEIGGEMLVPREFIDAKAPDENWSCQTDEHIKDNISADRNIVPGVEDVEIDLVTVIE